MGRWGLVLAGIVWLAAAVPAHAAPRPVVAVLDSGVDFTHPAFRRAAWRNPGEIARNGVDDDANGFVDDVNGADLVLRTAAGGDPRGHGTHVAGIVARGRRARIMAVRILGPDGRGTSTDLAAGIDYAVANRAQVINLSVSDYGDDPAVAAALARAGAAGVTVVAAAGNGGHDLDKRPVFPASYRTPGMLVVGATGFDGRLTSWSGRGARSVDLVAPGVAVRSALPRRRYGRKSGTSQAAAAVTRTVARVLAAAPAATQLTVRTVLLGTVDAAPSLTGTTTSGGLLDPRATLAAVASG
jgi:subtilisin family serine protease